MKFTLSWLTQYIDPGLPPAEIADRLTMAGLEVEEIHFIGLQPPPGERHDFKVTGMAWDKEKLVVGEILEVMPHLVTVLTDSAIRAADLDEAAAKLAKEEAERELAERTTTMEFNEAQAKLAKALAELQAVERLRKKARMKR